MDFPPKVKGKWLGLKDEEKIYWLDCAHDNFFNGPDQYTPKPNRTIYLDGLNIKSELDFYCEIGEAVNGPGGYFGRVFHGFDDCLFGGFGLEFPYKIIWQNAKESQKYLNNMALEKWLKDGNNEHEIFSEIRHSWGEDVSDLFTVFVDAISSVESRNGGKVEIILKNNG